MRSTLSAPQAGINLGGDANQWAAGLEDGGAIVIVIIICHLSDVCGPACVWPANAQGCGTAAHCMKSPSDV